MMMSFGMGMTPEQYQDLKTRTKEHVGECGTRLRFLTTSLTKRVCTIREFARIIEDIDWDDEEEGGTGKNLFAMKTMMDSLEDLTMRVIDLCLVVDHAEVKVRPNKGKTLEESLIGLFKQMAEGELSEGFASHKKCEACTNLREEFKDIHRFESDKPKPE